jgi:hypothetical protein
LELVGRSLYGQLDATPAFPGFVPLTTLELVLVLSHDKNTNQVSHFSFELLVAHEHFRAIRKTDIDDDRSDDEGESESEKDKQD